jgi:THO complex subunit 5
MPQTTEETYGAVINELKRLVNSNNPTKDISAIHIRAAALTGRLKSLARAANSATRATKNITAAARHDMDQSLLGLQNLLYEKRHLEREIEKCRQFA